jgi:hypothetical protein
MVDLKKKYTGQAINKQLKVRVAFRFLYHLRIICIIESKEITILDKLGPNLIYLSKKKVRNALKAEKK